MIRRNRQRFYQHFNEERYEVVQVGKTDTENPKRVIVTYKQLYESEFPIGTIWVRSLESFVEVIKKKRSNGAEYEGPRFTKI